MSKEDRNVPPSDDPAADGSAISPKETQKIAEQAAGSSKLCRWCSLSIPSSAIVCPICRCHQKWVWNYFSQFLLVVSACISIILVCISAGNFYLSKQNLNKTKEALAIAQSATTEALKAQTIASAAQAMLDDLSSVTEVNIAAISASHDIRALRKLWAMSHSTNARIRVLAEKQLKPILSQLRADYEAVISDYWGFKRIQDARYYGFDDMKNWKMAEYVKNYKKVPHDRRVVYVVQFLSDGKETDKEKMVFSYSIIQMESRPDVIYAICAFVDAKAKIKEDYLFRTDYYLTWLKNNYGNSKTSPKP